MTGCKTAGGSCDLGKWERPDSVSAKTHESRLLQLDELMELLTRSEKASTTCVVREGLVIHTCTDTHTHTHCCYTAAHRVQETHYLLLVLSEMPSPLAAAMYFHGSGSPAAKPL